MAGTMKSSNSQEIDINEMRKNLVTFSLDREDIKYILSTLPESSELNFVTIEYEIQLLKILSVGWAISVYLDDGPLKTKLSEMFWMDIHEFSVNLSNVSSTTMGKDFNYFNVLKERMDMYVRALNKNSEASEPAIVIGPVFANTCGSKDNAYAVLAGSKIFKTSVDSTKRYLDLFPSP